MDRFGLSREAETYELVLALSAFTRRPRSPLDTIAVSIPIVPPRSRSALPGAYLRIHAAHVTHTRRHTPIRGEIYEWHRRLSSNYPPIRLRPTTAYLPAIRRAGRSPPTLGRDCCEPPWCTTSPHRVHLRTLARQGDTPVCVCVSRLISTSAGIGSRVTQPRIKAGLRHTTDIYTGVPGLATRRSGGLSHLLVMGSIPARSIDRMIHSDVPRQGWLPPPSNIFTSCGIEGRKEGEERNDRSDFRSRARSVCKK